MNKKDLENRLINFSTFIIEISEKISKTYAGIVLAKQIVRSGTSVSLNYGEAQSAESRKDFIHKLKIILKELRETMVSLKLLYKSNLTDKNVLQQAINECNELISIFVRSIETARKNLKSENR